MVHNDYQISMRPLYLIMFFYTCRLHVDDLFDEMPLMANRGLVMDLFNLCLLHHCFHVILLILSYDSILGSGMGFGPKKVA